MNHRLPVTWPIRGKDIPVVVAFSLTPTTGGADELAIYEIRTPEGKKLKARRYTEAELALLGKMCFRATGTCAVCDGHGRVIIPVGDGNDPTKGATIRCPRCKGAGKTPMKAAASEC